MTDEVAKTIGIKQVGTGLPAQTVSVLPGTTVADVLNELGFNPAEHSLMDPANQDAVFRSGDAIFARVSNGDMLSVGAVVDAGQEAA